MARFYTEIKKEDFLEKIKSIMITSDDIENFEKDEIFIDYDEFPWNLGYQTGTKNIKKDLSKVEFTFDNFTSFQYPENFSNYPVGYMELKTGFHTFFVNAGGDWEFPICFVLYWGNKKMRAYIPKDGNAWNKKEKCAYGSEANPLYHNGQIGVNEVSEERIISEILKHITLKK